MIKTYDLTGQRFNRLVVLNREDDMVDSYGRKYPMWLCQCDCGNKKIISGYNLKRNVTKSCGCLVREKTIESRKKYNEYNLSGEYGVGYTYNIDPTDPEHKRNYFYFDLEDYEKIKDYCWGFTAQGYIETHEPNTSRAILLHRLVMGIVDDMFKVVDHIKHNVYDNRKKYLRVVSKRQNQMNQKLRKDNSTGYKGVHFDKQTGKYRVTIGNKSLKRYDTLEEAIEARKIAVQKEYGEYSYEESMAYE